MAEFLSAMSGPELLGFGIFLTMTTVFFGWIGYLASSK